eukprot:COSAG01_NODE_62874_length_282_cov_1.131148_1_plen_46_part_10
MPGLGWAAAVLGGPPRPLLAASCPLLGEEDVLAWPVEHTLGCLRLP